MDFSRNLQFLYITLDASLALRAPLKSFQGVFLARETRDILPEENRISRNKKGLYHKFTVFRETGDLACLTV